MKIITLLISFIFLSSTVFAEEQVQIEIVEFGVYSGTDGNSVSDTSAPTGQRFMEGQTKLIEQTDKIPATLGGKFGFEFVVKGNKGASIPLTVVYNFPKMTDPKTHREITHYKTNIKTRPDEIHPRMLWDFTESWELVSGEWTFQIYQGQKKLVEKKFTVVKQ